MEDKLDNIIDKAKNNEPGITKILQELCNKHGGELKGLEFKFKSREKIKKKLKLKGIDYNLRDVLRYTIVFSTDKYFSGVHIIYNKLKDKGFKTKHTWIKQKWCAGDLYQGINTSWSYNNY